MEKQKIYKAALYLRVSKEDTEKVISNQLYFSNSIENQKRFLLEYVKQMSEVVVYDFYIDDGYSGLVFDKRPGFLRMWKDIINKTVNMVVVKDLSRFGREHIKTDVYIQKIFPSLGVRFLAVMDSYDSLYAKEGEQQLLIPVKNFINDHYARDISLKIRSSQETMRREGIYAGAYVPYGYQKKQGRLCPDVESALVIKLIFLMKLEGESAKEIAKRLHRWGIPSPAEFRRERGEAYFTGFQVQKVAEWSGMSVDRILKDRVYTGTLEQGKRMRISYKVRMVISVPKERWSVVKGTHCAIISEREYKLVQQLSLLDMRRAPEQTSVYRFSGLLFCRDCGRSMTRRTGRSKDKRKSYYLCSSYNKGEGCTRHSISEELVFQMVWNMVQLYKNRYQLIEEKIIYDNWNRGKQERSIWDLFIQKNLERIEKYKKRLEQVEEDFYKGFLNRQEYESYQCIYRNEQKRMEQAVILCKQEKKRREEDGSWEKIMPERLLFVLLIKGIQVYEGKKISIRFRFQMDI